ncbi:hypothetical protein Riv7116_3706 [Rivularia sp. PCC 7116]|uniref:hypothetical protein n=1 Tax=Rivularia sp. PCC 7116 TaxID=373994 RepID=UPI00029EFC57|nr:hypothetical protein [Rivularia sp. PCC 7116]AFY56152.1 hypothetical protein Riv7116_3706 [Rivularia sp. PCC 7116]
MNRSSVSLIMLGFGIVAYVLKLNAAIAFSPPQLLTAQAELVSLFSQLNTDNPVVAASGWKKFYSDEGNFSIFVPSTSVANLNSNSEEYSINIYYADTKKSSYIVGYVDYNTDLTNLPLDEVYHQFLKDFLGNQVNFINQKNIKLGQYSGIEVEYQSNNQKIAAKSRLFLVDQRLYILDISNYKAGDANQFFNSFKLEKNIKENPSEIAVNI